LVLLTEYRAVPPQQSALKVDADAVNDHIDIPALRKSIGGQMGGAMTAKSSGS
jgi:hypothetical protein